MNNFVALKFHSSLIIFTHPEDEEKNALIHNPYHTNKLLFLVTIFTKQLFGNRFCCHGVGEKDSKTVLIFRIEFFASDRNF